MKKKDVESHQNACNEILEEAFALLSLEERVEQKQMAQRIYEAYENNEIALIEAGTGIGKSLAYLVPAFLWALKHQEKTIISTHTISLQEQLIHKDIPFLIKALNLDIQAMLVKGMNNYLCLRRLDDVEETKEIDKLKIWAEKTREGSRSEVPFPLPASTWDQVKAESDFCTHVHCPHYKQCFFFKARRKVDEAQILIVNHSLLMTQKVKGKEGVLPDVQRIIIDEAHHLEEITLEKLSKRYSRRGLLRLLGKEVDFPAEKLALVNKIDAAFTGLKGSFSLLKPDHMFWTSGAKEHFTELADALKKYAQNLFSLQKSLEHRKEKQTTLMTIATRLEENAEGLLAFFADTADRKKVRWIEEETLVDAQLDVSAYLEKEFFGPTQTVSLCSATLTTSRSFHFLRERLGIKSARTTENIYDSPFDYKNRTLLLVPTDIPDPNEPTFIEAASERIRQAVEASEGNAFVLFTSYDMLEKCFEKVAPQLPYPVLKQGDLSRQVLIEKFKEQEGAVLFGTDSFWEGVDVAGESLRCVIIAKLPFKAPNDPLMEAHAHALTAEGKNPFFDYAVPHAVVKFKQGFGRLMRQKSDRGCILCLDKRIVTKAYGKIFLNSLPPCQTLFVKTDKVMEAMEDFYKRVGV